MKFHFCSQFLSLLFLHSNRIFRNCHEGAEEPAWMSAVKAELKAGQSKLLEKLLETEIGAKFAHAKYRIISKNEEERKKRFREAEKTPSTFEGVQLIVPRILVKDLRTHSWWGPKVKQLLLDQEQEQAQEVTPKVQMTKKPGPRVLDLNQMLRRSYSNMLDFHLDLKKVARSVHVADKAKAEKELFEEYSKLIRDIFPWFDVANPKANYESQDLIVAEPHVDHAYHVTSDDGDEKKSSGSDPPVWKKSEPRLPPEEDRRKCLLCQRLRDGSSSGAGRLLYFRQNEWLHVNCALWSSEVYEECDGSLQNVGQAQSRGNSLNTVKSRFYRISI